MDQNPALSSKCHICFTPKERIDSRFCKKCGMKFDIGTQEDNSIPNTGVSIPQRFICSNSTCGRSFLEGRFCKQCGSKLIRLDDSPLISPEPIPRAFSPPPIRATSPPPVQKERYSTPNPQRPLSFHIGTKDIKELEKEFLDLSSKYRTREDRSISVGTANFNHCSVCKAVGTGKFCNICGKPYDTFMEETFTLLPETKIKSSGSEIKARPNRASSLIKANDVDELLKKIMEEKPKDKTQSLPQSSQSQPQSSPSTTQNKLETSSSFNQPSEIKQQLGPKSNSTLPFLSNTSQKEEVKTGASMSTIPPLTKSHSAEFKSISQSSNLTSSMPDVKNNRSSPSNEAKLLASRYTATPSSPSSTNLVASMNEVKTIPRTNSPSSEAKSTSTKASPLSHSNTSTSMFDVRNPSSNPNSPSIQTKPRTNSLVIDPTKRKKGSQSPQLSSSPNNSITEGYGVKIPVSEEDFHLYATPDPVEFPIYSWLKQHSLDTEAFRNALDKLGAKELEDLNDVLEILEDPNYRNQHGLNIELTPIEFRKLAKAIKTTIETEELKHFPILQNITIEDKIGEGHFGQVYRGRWGSTTIALKHIGSNKHEFFREANVLIKLRHPNVVLFLGIFNDKGTLYMCTEYVSGGNLIEFLYQRREDLSTTDLLKIAHSGVSGLIYLSQHKIVHRDIAARNFLITSQEGRFILKVSDFGMSRFFEDYYASSNKTLPIKWSAIEAIEFKKFSTASDVWSFSVSLWELFEFGKEPYIGMTNIEVIEFLKSQKRLSKPTLCPDTLYQTMLLSWNTDPTKRPKFEDIATVLEKLLDKLVSPEESLSIISNPNGSSFSINSNKPNLTPANYVGNYNNYQEPTQKFN